MMLATADAAAEAMSGVTLETWLSPIVNKIVVKLQKVEKSKVKDNKEINAKKTLKKVTGNVTEAPKNVKRK